MIRFVRFFLLGVALLGLLVVQVPAQNTRGPVVPGDYKPDYPLLRSEIQTFENAVNNTIKTAFSGSTLPLMPKTKGVYLQGYGVAFSIVVNIDRALVTPFGVVQGETSTPEQKRRRIEDAIQRVSRTLLENGKNLRQVPRDEAITVVLYIEDRNFPDEQNLNRTIVLSVLKKDMDEAIQKEDPWKEFKLRMKTVEY